MMHKQTRYARDGKQAQRERLISEMEEELGLLSEHPEDQGILDTKASEIVESLKSRKSGWSAERVMIAFIRAACDAHRKTNCLTEILFREGLSRARQLDQEFARTGKAEGAFWGLPSSFKDTYNIVGVDSSVGCSPHCFQPLEDAYEEAGLVKRYREAGGIPFCKTNIPQTLLAFECANPIFGPASNPYASSRVPGGSSGGEAALVTLRGTPIGWGSDIGGSLRIPAAYSGCCGLKPVAGRWPSSGQRRVVFGFEGIKGVTGPMAKSVGELKFQSKAMLEMVSDPNYHSHLSGEQLIPLPWRDTKLPEKLKIGYYTQDGAVKISPACTRAVEETVAALRKAGHDVVEFQPPDVPEALKVFAGLTSSDGYKSLLGNLGPDPMEPSMRLVTIGSKLPRFLHWLLCLLVQYILKDIVFASIFATSRPKGVPEFWSFTNRRDEYAKRFRKLASRLLTRAIDFPVWEDHGLDAIICPVQAVPALEHGRTTFLSPLSIGTILYNVVDSTVGVLPITRVDKSRDTTPPDYLKGINGSWILEKRVYGGKDPAYDANKMHGLPVGIQVVGKAWEEEKVLGIMEVIEDLVAYR